MTFSQGIANNMLARNPTQIHAHSEKQCHQLSVESFRCLPERFHLEDIKPFLTQEKIASVKKIHALWQDGIALTIYGSFVLQCGRILIGKKPTSAKDIDASSALISLNDFPNLYAKLMRHGFKPKELEIKFTPSSPQTFYGFECNHGLINVDFTAHLSNYISGPNTLLSSSFTLHFVEGRSPTDICFEFDKCKLQLEYYCNHSIYPILTPHVGERGVMRRILRQIKNNRNLYENNELHMYYKHQRIEKFTSEDKVWRKLTDLLKYDFKNTVGTRKFMSYFNEMRRMIKEHTFFMPEATTFIKNFCEVLIENYFATHHFINKNAEQEANNMTLVLQKYFSVKVGEADKFFEVVTYLLLHVDDLKNQDPSRIDQLLHRMNTSIPQPKSYSYTPKLFAASRHMSTKSYGKAIEKNM